MNRSQDKSINSRIVNTIKYALLDGELPEKFSVSQLKELFRNKSVSVKEGTYNVFFAKHSENSNWDTERDYTEYFLDHKDGTYSLLDTWKIPK